MPQFAQSSHFAPIDPFRLILYVSSALGLPATLDFRAERLNRGLSQEAMAAHIGIPRRVWQRAEAGFGVRAQHALSIADYFGLQVTDIWPVEEEGA